MKPANALGRTSSQSMAIERVARTVRRTEVAVTEHEIELWGDLETIKIDLAARAKAVQLALDRDLELLERGMQRANGNRVAQELVLRYVEDQNQDFRLQIRQVLDS
ncbi:MAG TPA: hypothetical protein VNA57_00100 [Acidimicrobiales bacterium]|nr:hypothetical protein [Acidimicrobiales bacterium]